MFVKKAIWLLMLVWLLCAAQPSALADAETLPILSETAVLMCADSGQVLFEKDMHRPMAPASITKIMTALLALEHGSLDDTLTVGAAGVGPLIDGAANIALKPGEGLSLRDLLYALMLPSANDAALLIAEHIGGSQEAFAAMMNEKAASLGALHTQFLNPHGLTEPGHETTAYDMACMMRAALANPVFVEIASAHTHTIEPTNMTPEPRALRHTHAMVLPRANADFPFDGILCGKTGFTTPSGHTLATAARRDDRTLIAVVIKSIGTTDKYLDSVMLLEYGFSAFLDVSLPLDTIAAMPVTPPDSDESWTAAPAAGDDAAFLLHHSLAQTPIEARYSLPATLTEGADRQATVSLLLPDGNGVMYPHLWDGAASLALTADPPSDPLADTQDRSTPASRSSNETGKGPDLWLIAVFVFLLASLFAAILLFMADRGKRKRRRRR